MSINVSTSCILLEKTHELYLGNLSKKGIKAGFQRNVTCRGGYLLALISSPLTASFDLLFGSIAAIGSILTGGCIRPLNRAAHKMTEGGGAGLFSYTYVGLIRVINPEANFIINKDCDGIVSEILGKKIYLFARKLRDSDNLLAKHVLSRIVYLGFALSSIVTRVIDLVIGILAAIGSLLTLGKFKKLNDFACEGLKAPLIIHDLYLGLVKTINPWTMCTTA